MASLEEDDREDELIVKFSPENSEFVIEAVVDSSEDEIFFGPMTNREKKRFVKYARRKTEVYYKGFRDDMSIIDSSLDDAEAEDLYENESIFTNKDAEMGNLLCEDVDEALDDSLEVKNDEIGPKELPLCKDFEDVKLMSVPDDDDVNGEEVEEFKVVDMLNDSLDVHRRRSLQTIVADVPAQEDVSCVSETSVEEESSLDDDSLDVEVEARDSCSQDYFSLPSQSSTTPSGDPVHTNHTEIIINVEEATPPSQSTCNEAEEQHFVSYESHFVTAVESWVSINVPDVSSLSEDDAMPIFEGAASNSENDIKITCCLPVTSLAPLTLINSNAWHACPGEDLSGIGRDSSIISGVETLMSSICMSEDSLEKTNAVQEESKLDEPVAQSTFLTRPSDEIDVYPSSDSSQSSPKEQQEKDIADLSSEIKNVSCQTSFALTAMPTDAEKDAELCVPRGVETPQQLVQTSTRKLVTKTSHLPRAIKKAAKDEDPKIKPSMELRSKTTIDVDVLPKTSRLGTFKTPSPMVFFKKSAKQKFKHVRSPIAAYIRDDPAQPLIQNIKPKSSRGINYGVGQPSIKPVTKKKGSQRVMGNILKENRDNFTQPLPVVDEAICSAHHEGDKADENVDPFQSPLPFVRYKGSKAMVQKGWDQVTKLHTATNKNMKILSPRTPIVIKHTGQHKRIHWPDAEHLVSKGSKAFSPSRPTGIAPPILLKGIDFNNSIVDGPNTIDASIVEVANAGSTKTLFK